MVIFKKSLQHALYKYKIRITNRYTHLVEPSVYICKIILFCLKKHIPAFHINTYGFHKHYCKRNRMKRSENEKKLNELPLRFQSNIFLHVLNTE